jgi:hypothetical protein
MPRRVATEDDWEDDGDESWTPDDEDEEWVPDDEDEDPTAECPHCHEPVFDQAERCPNCGWYISEEDVPPRRWPAWVMIGFVLALAGALLWAV